MTKKNILCVFGTRPEVIKMASIITQLKNDQECSLRVLSTAQHRDMLDQMLNIFSIVPDCDLNIMEKNQSLASLTSKLPLPLDRVLKKEKPDIVLVQGDTTTAFLMSLACFYRKIPVGHVEAGLRTKAFYNPFPEEMNRVLISRLSTLHFAPTEQAKENLLQEGCEKTQIFVTGNTVIDALKTLINRNVPLKLPLEEDKKLVLATLHRREHFGAPIEHICEALRILIEKNDDLQLLLPVHPNPHVKSTVYKILKNHPRIILTEPLPYDQFVKLMQKAYLILTDSGGVQEEAPYLGTPVLVLRENTERPEGADCGASKLIGINKEKIIRQTQNLLDDKNLYQTMKCSSCPYGDGTSGNKIIEIVKRHLQCTP